MTQNPSFISSKLSELGQVIQTFIISVFSFIKYKKEKKIYLKGLFNITTVIANIY